jgi:hypothetical protein
MLESLEKLKSELNHIGNIIIEKVDAASLALAGVSEGLEEFKAQLAVLKNELGKVGKNATDAADATRSSVADKVKEALFAIMIGVGTGVAADRIDRRLGKAQSSVPDPIFVGGGAVSTNSSALKRSIQARSNSFGKAAKIGAGLVAVGGLLAIAENAFAATGAVDELSNAADALSGSLSGDSQSASAFSGILGIVLEGPGTVVPLLGLAGAAFSGLGAELKTVGAAAMANPVLALVAALAAGAEISAAGLGRSEGADFVLSPDAAGNVAAFLDSAGRAVRDFGAFFLDGAGSFLSGLFGGDASASVSHAPAAAGPTDNSTTTTINGGITVQTNATDAQGIARDIGRSVESAMTATANSSNGF